MSSRFCDGVPDRAPCRNDPHTRRVFQPRSSGRDPTGTTPPPAGWRPGAGRDRGRDGGASGTGGQLRRRINTERALRSRGPAAAGGRPGRPRSETAPPTVGREPGPRSEGVGTDGFEDGSTRTRVFRSGGSAAEGRHDRPRPDRSHRPPSTGPGGQAPLPSAFARRRRGGRMSLTAIRPTCRPRIMTGTDFPSPKNWAARILAGPPGCRPRPGGRSR